MNGVKLAEAYIIFESDHNKLLQDLAKVEKQAESTYGNIVKSGQKAEKAAKSFNTEVNRTENIFKQMASAAKNSFGVIGGAISMTIGMLNALKNVATFALGTSFTIGTSIAKFAINSLIKVIKTLLTTINKIATVFPSVIKGIIVGFWQASAAVRKFLNDLQKHFVFFQLDIKYITKQMQQLAVVTGATIGGSLITLVKYQESFVRVRKVVDLTEASLTKLSNNIRAMSTEIVTSSRDLAEMAAVGGQLGIEGVEDLTKFTDVLSKLAIATKIAGETGAAQFARLTKIMGETIDSTENMASSIVDLGNKFAAFEDEILTMSFKLAGAGSFVGLTTQEVLGLSTALSAAGVRAERGGTAVSRILMDMANNVALGNKELEYFAIISGKSIKDFSALVKTKPIEALGAFISGLSRLNDEGKNVFEMLDKAKVDQIRTRDVILRLAEAENLLSDAIEVSNTAWAENIALSEETARRLETVWAQILLLKNQVLDVAITIAEKYEPALRKSLGVLRATVAIFGDLNNSQKNTIVQFLSLTAAVAGTITGLLLLTKAIFTFLTGITLFVRLGVMLIPAIAALWAIHKVMTKLTDVFGIENINLIDSGVKTFKALKDTLVGLFDAIKTSDSGSVFKTLFEGYSSAWQDFVKETQELSKNENLLPGLFTIKSMTNFSNMIQTMAKDTRIAVDTLKTLNSLDSKSTTWNDVMQNLTPEQQEYLTAVKDLVKAMWGAFSETIKLTFDIGKLLFSILTNAKNKSLVSDAGAKVGTWFKTGFESLRLKANENLLPKSTEFNNTIAQLLQDFEKNFTLDPEQAWLEKALANTNLTEVEKNWLKSFSNIGVGLLLAFKRLVIEMGKLLLTSVDWEERGKKIGQGVRKGFKGIVEGALNLTAPGSKMNPTKPAGGGGGAAGYGDQTFLGNLGIFAYGALSPDWTIKEMQDLYERLGFDYQAAVSEAQRIGLEKKAQGAILPGFGGGDRIPALLEAGEAVVPSRVVQGGLASILEWFKRAGVSKFQTGKMPDSLTRIASAANIPMPDFEELTKSIDKMKTAWLDKMDTIVDVLQTGIFKTLDFIAKIISEFIPIVVNTFAKSPLDAEVKTMKYEFMLKGFVDSMKDWLNKVTNLGADDEVTLPEEKKEVPSGTIYPIEPRRADMSFLGRDSGGGSIPIDVEHLAVAQMSKWDQMIYVFTYKIDTTFTNLQSKWEETTSKMQDWLSTPMKENLEAIKNNFADWLTKNGAEITNFFASLRSTAIQSSNAGSAMVKGATQAGEATGGDPVAMILGAIQGLMTQSETFAQILNIINPILQALADMLGMLLEPFLPLIQVLSMALTPVFKAIGIVLQELLLPVLKILFPVFKFLGEAVLLVAEVFFIIRGWILNAVGGLVKGIGTFINALLGWITSLGRDLIRAGNELINKGLKSYEQAEELAQARKELSELTWDEAMAKAEAAEETNKLTESLKNVPEGFRVALERFRSTEPVNAIPSAASGAWVQSAGIIRVHENEEIVPANKASIQSGGNVYEITVNGDIYGIDDFKTTIKQIFEEVTNDENYRATGSIIRTDTPYVR